MTTHRRAPFAAFVTPIRFEHPEGPGDSSARVLVLHRNTVRLLLRDLDTAAHLSRRYSDGTGLVVDHTFNLCELTPSLVEGSAQVEAGTHALPIDGPGFGFLEEPRQVQGKLHLRRDRLYWRVSSSGWDRGFRTGFVSRADLMEWRLLTTTRKGVPGAFRRLAEEVPERALAILRRGTCFNRRFATDNPYKVVLPPEAVEPLLVHGDPEVRESAIRFMGSSPVLAGDG